MKETTPLIDDLGKALAALRTGHSPRELARILKNRLLERWRLPFYRMVAQRPGWFFPVLRSLTADPLIVPFYHLVADHSPPHVRHLYPHQNRAGFAEQIEFLARRYRPLDPAELTRPGAGRGWSRSHGAGCCIVTFDDGLREAYEHAVPILLHHGMPAIFFINSATLDNRQLTPCHRASLLVEAMLDSAAHSRVHDYFHSQGMAVTDPIQAILGLDYLQQAHLERLATLLEVDLPGYLERERPYLTTAQLHELRAQGFLIGAHSIDHPYYPLLEPTVQVEQTIDSTRELQAECGLDYALFAFPFGDYHLPRQLFDTLFAAGIDLTFGTDGLKEDFTPRSLQRVALEGATDPVLQVLAGIYAERLIRTWMGCNRIHRE